MKEPLYAVADGMGGHAAGEVASEIAVDILAGRTDEIFDAESLIDTVRLINRSIIEAAKTGLGRPGMGTTLTVAVIDGTRMLIAQVGDSRAYLTHNGKLQQLTRDHSYVGELLAGGHISESEAANHPKRSVITRALGSDPKTEADIYELEAAVGDRLLLCSDGLYGMVPDSDIEQILNSSESPDVACERLIDAACAGGGLDNISAIVVDIINDQSEFIQFSGTEDSSSSPRHAGRERGASRAPQNKRRRLHVGIIAFVVLLVILIASAIGGVYWYASNTAFLRTGNSGMVEVYRGLPGEVLPGLHLEWHEYNSDVKAADLLSTTADRLEEGVQVDSLDAAAILIADYEEQIRERNTARTAQPNQTNESNQSNQSAQEGQSAGSSGTGQEDTAQ